MKIEAGTVVIVEALTWEAGWEFDAPVVILSPVVRSYDSGTMADAIEDVCIDASVEGEFRGDDPSLDAYSFWGYGLPTLKRRFREALAGKDFPIRGYQARRVAVQFFEQDGELVSGEVYYATDALYPPDAPLCVQCGRRYSAQERRAGFRTCEHCIRPTQEVA